MDDWCEVGKLLQHISDQHCFIQNRLDQIQIRPHYLLLVLNELVNEDVEEGYLSVHYLGYSH